MTGDTGASDRALVMFVRAIVAAGAATALAGSVALAATEGLSGDVANLILGVPALAVGFAAVAWIAVGSQPRNVLIWVLASFVVGLGVYAAGKAAIAVMVPDVSLPLDVGTQIPAELPTAAAWVQGWTEAVATLGFFNLLTFGLLLFPDGRLPSRRWRPLAAVIATGLVAVTAFQVVLWHPESTVAPYGPGGPGHKAAWAVVNLFLIWGPLASLVGIVMRYRKSALAARRQFKWIMWGAAVLLPAAVAGSLAAAPILTLAGVLVFVAAYGVAITRHRLFDVDLVITRTVVYGSLAAFIGVVYVAFVVGVGAVAGGTDRPNTGLAIAATTVVAVAFQPARRRLERLASQLVFGRKATPYMVLSEFAKRVAATGDVPLGDIARSLTEGTRAERVAIRMAIDGHLVEAASWPEGRSQPTAAVVRFAIEDAGTTLGSLDLHLPAAHELTSEDRRLAEGLASGLSLALRNQMLTERLAARVEVLRESRRRIVALQDETRRRLERDLHDGAQQQLVALRINLGVTQTIAERDGALRTAALLEEVKGAAEEAVESMREFARGVYPPLLEAEGLRPAISAQARRLPIPVTVEFDGIERYDATLEGTIYFCVLEALRNCVLRAGASGAVVRLSQRNGEVIFEVCDDGAGHGAGSGVEPGVTAIADRVEAIAGTMTVTCTPGQGTVVTGTVPMPAEPPR